jgi:anaerobic selenocysteine-containing dehydrogenase
MNQTQPSGAGRTFVKTTCPRDCYDACGISVVKDDGVVRRVLGDPDHAIAKGTLCGKCAVTYNGAWRSADQRLLTPLRRVGAKGAGLFEPVSWDAALADIAARLGGVIGEGAQKSIIHTHYTGTVALISGWYPIRFFNRIGATEVDPDTVCNKAGHVALELMLGSSLDGFDPETVDEAAMVLIWGANPAHSAPHQFKTWLGRVKGPIVVIDPIATGTARRADLHLKPRPGTDAALAFGLMHAAAAEGLLDNDFIAAHTIGFEEIRADISAATPERTAELTGVPADDIRAAARLYARGPSLLWLGQGMQRQPRGGNAFRAAAALALATGNIGKPGAGLIYMNGPAARGIDMASLTAPHLAATAPPSVSHMDLAATLANPAAARVLFTWNNNIMASSPQQAALGAALKREDLLHVAVDIFHTDTTRFADYVLPAASFLEFDDLILSYFDLTISAQAKAMEPMGESLPNQEIFRRLAAAMGLDDPELFESDEALLARLLAQTPFSGTFADLAARGTVRAFPERRVPFAGGVFPTASGRAEIACAAAEAAGYPRTPYPHADAPPPSGRFRVLSPASLWQMNSSYGNDEKILKQLGAPRVIVHPDDAAALGLTEADEVVLGNAVGRLAVTVAVSAEAQPGMFVIHKGRWPGLDTSGANVNVLFDGAKADIAESTSVHGVEVGLLEVRKAREAMPA